MSISFIIQLVAIIISISCSLLGVFLVLKNMSMLTDAITHTVLLGIVLAFLVTKDLSSPFLILGATSIGILTVYLVEVISLSKIIKEDSAIALVLSIFFSLAIFLVSKYTSNIHLDVDAVLLGEIAFVPFNKLNLLGLELPKSLFYGIMMLILNILFVYLFFKELKISTFDKSLAYSLGMKPILVHYILMTLVSTTSIVSFEAVGSILLISFMIGPPMSAYLISNNLKKMIFLSIFIGFISSIIGYNIAILFDISISGMISVVIGVIFLIIFFSKVFYKKVFKLC